MQDLVTLDAGLHVVYVSSYADVITKFSWMDSLPNMFSHGATLGHARSSAKNCKGDRPHMLTGMNPFKTFYILLQWEEFNEGDGNKNVQKTVGSISKTTTSHVHHTFLYISFPFLHHYDVKTPFSRFIERTIGGRKQATTKFYFSFSGAWIKWLEIQLQEGSPTFDKVSG